MAAALDIKTGGRSNSPSSQKLILDSTEKLMNSDLRKDLRLMEVIHSGSLNDQQLHELV